MRIKVLWIDDDCHTTGRDFIGDAEQDGIDIVPFESHEEGIAELMDHIKEYHAVILDAKVKKGKYDTVTNLKGLAASRDKLIELNNQGVYLPYFIFTGQPDHMKSEDFRDSYGEFFIKSIDNQKLFDSIKKAVYNKEEYIIQRNYAKIFEICDKFFDGDTKQLLINILAIINNPSSFFDDKLYFTQLRIVVEKIFVHCNKLGLLHNKCIEKGMVNLSESCLFLSGETTRYSKVFSEKKHLTKVLSTNLKNLIFISGSASHIKPITDEYNHLDIHAYRVYIKSPYLLYSLTFQLLDLILWLDEYSKKNGDYNINVSYWKPLPYGTVINFNQQKGYAFLKFEDSGDSIFIPPHLVEEHELMEGMKIRGEIEEYQDNKKGEVRKRIKSIVK